MDLLEIGKDLIKKGTELGDEELVQQGYSLVSKYSDDKPMLVEPDPNAFDWLCTNCNHEFTDKPTRKRCPECKKQTLSAVVIPVKETVEPSDKKNKGYDDDFTMHRKQPKRTFIDEETGEEKTYTKSESISTHTFANKYDDEGMFHNDTTSFDSKVVFNKSPKRPKAKKRTKKCEECNREFRVTSPKEYKCTKCLRKGVRT